MSSDRLKDATAQVRRSRPSPRFNGEDYQRIDEKLAESDRLLSLNYTGDSNQRQPIHTVYVSAEKLTSETVQEWGDEARSVLEQQGGTEEVCRRIGVPEAYAEEVARLVDYKLLHEPIEDLRVDFEDGYKNEDPDQEDQDAVQAAEIISNSRLLGSATPFCGIRIKSLELSTRRRAMETLDLFFGALSDFKTDLDTLKLTLPKVTAVAQIEAMSDLCGRLEESYELDNGRLSFEVQVETPQVIISAEGKIPVAQLLHAGRGRVNALHFGTYDYSASLGISGGYQALDHSSADFAKHMMQVAAAGTGVTLSDGSTNVLPIGDTDQVFAAWNLHSGLIKRSLINGFYQGWDLHPAQLPSRFIATYSFFREGFATASHRIRDYIHGRQSRVLDEPATVKALANFFLRGHLCGAITQEDIESRIDTSVSDLADLANGRRPDQFSAAEKEE